jgi:hypothetical protein
MVFEILTNLPEFNENPGGQEHVYEPSLFWQEYLHGDGLSAHSLISKQRVPELSTL